MQFEISAKKINNAITVANFRKTYYSFVNEFQLVRKFMFVKTRSFLLHVITR